MCMHIAKYVCYFTLAIHCSGTLLFSTEASISLQLLMTIAHTFEQYHTMLSVIVMVVCELLLIHQILPISYWCLIDSSNMSKDKPLLSESTALLSIV